MHLYIDIFGSKNNLQNNINCKMTITQKATKRQQKGLVNDICGKEKMIRNNTTI